MGSMNELYQEQEMYPHGVLPLEPISVSDPITYIIS